MINHSSQIRCEDVRPLLRKFQNVSLDAGLQGRISTHILSCKSCANQYNKMDERGGGLNIQLGNRRFYSMIAIAASIIILLGIGFVLLNDNAGKTEISLADDLVDTTGNQHESSLVDTILISRNKIHEDVIDLNPSQNEKVLIAESFIPNKRLEISRSKKFRSMIRIISPLDSAVFNPGEPISFAIENARATIYIIKILNNKGERIKEFELIQNNHTINETLAPGLYYWKLEIEKESLGTWRFYIRDE